jgi:hypothetical protein
VTRSVSLPRETLKATKDNLSEEATQCFFYTCCEPVNAEIHGPIYERAIFRRNEHKLQTKCCGKYMDITGLQNRNIIGTFVVYGILEQQL